MTWSVATNEQDREQCSFLQQGQWYSSLETSTTVAHAIPLINCNAALPRLQNWMQLPIYSSVAATLAALRPGPCIVIFDRSRHLLMHPNNLAWGQVAWTRGSCHCTLDLAIPCLPCMPFGPHRLRFSDWFRGASWEHSRSWNNFTPYS